MCAPTDDSFHGPATDIATWPATHIERSRTSGASSSGPRARDFDVRGRFNNPRRPRGPASPGKPGRPILDRHSTVRSPSLWCSAGAVSLAYVVVGPWFGGSGGHRVSVVVGVCCATATAATRIVRLRKRKQFSSRSRLRSPLTRAVPTPSREGGIGALTRVPLARFSAHVSSRFRSRAHGSVAMRGATRATAPRQTGLHHRIGDRCAATVSSMASLTWPGRSSSTISAPRPSPLRR